MNKNKNEDGFDKLFKKSKLIRTNNKKPLDKRLTKLVESLLTVGIEELFRNDKSITENELYCRCRLVLFKYFFNKTSYQYYILDSEIFDFEEVRNLNRKSKNKLLLHYLYKFRNSISNCGIVFRKREDGIKINMFDNDFKIIEESSIRNKFFKFPLVDIEVGKFEYNEFEIITNRLRDLVGRKYRILNGWWNNVLKYEKLKQNDYEEYMKCTFLKINKMSDSIYKRFDLDFGMCREDVIINLLIIYDFGNFEKMVKGRINKRYFGWDDHNNLRSWIILNRKRCIDLYGTDSYFREYI